jgi:hypothetical protein
MLNPYYDLGLNMISGIPTKISIVILLEVLN